MKKIIISVDIDANERSGPAAISVHAFNEAEDTIFEFTESIGNAVSSYAGYYAIMRVLQSLQEKFEDSVRDNEYEIKLDNEMIVQQLRFEKQITEPSLVPLFIEIHNMRISSFPNMVFTYSAAKVA